jgi:hypothetical protein
MSDLHLTYEDLEKFFRRGDLNLSQMLLIHELRRLNDSINHPEDFNIITTLQGISISIEELTDAIINK